MVFPPPQDHWKDEEAMHFNFVHKSEVTRTREETINLDERRDSM